MLRLEITDPATGTIYAPHLPASLTFELVRENPLFTRRGDYTYDIDISLRDPHNRAIYNHIDRLTAKTRPQNRRARLLCDGHVVADGTEVILKLEADSVKIQILAGNSELNYLTAADDLRIRKLDLGKTTRDRYADRQIYPNSHYTYPLLEVPDDESFKYRNNGLLHFIPTDTGYELNYRAQNQECPFIVYIIEKVIEAVGYTVRTNDLADDPRWQRLVIINEFKTEFYAKMLPSWTVNEFLEQVETFFDCIFICQGDQVDILRTASFFNITNAIDIPADTILDDHEKDFTKDTNDLHLFRRSIEYAFDNDVFGAVNNFSQEVEDKCQELDTTLDNLPSDYMQAWRILHETNCGFDFVELAEEEGDDYNHRRYIIKQFGPHQEDGESCFNLKIVPAEVNVKTGDMYEREPRASTPTYTRHERCAWLAAKISLADTQTDFSWVEFSKNVLSHQSEEGRDTMKVAFVAELPIFASTEVAGKNTNYYTQLTYWAPFTTYQYLATNRKDRISEFFDLRDMNSIIPQDAIYDLRLNGDTGRMAQEADAREVIDVTQCHTIRFKTKTYLDPMRQFLINNRLYLCQQLKYTFTDGHQHPIVEGVFYPYI